MKPQSLVYASIGLAVAIAMTGISPTRKLEAQDFNLSQQPPDWSDQVDPKDRMGMPHDRYFIEKMIPHHAAAVEMADVALTQAKHPELKQLSIAIKKTQAQEIQEMRRWYKQWYGMEVPSAGKGGIGMIGGGQGGMAMHSGMMNRMGMQMDMQPDLTRLKLASDFDREFIRQMIPHHQMAVMMSSMILNSEHPELRSLAQSIVQSQTAEIRQMQQWQKAWHS
jgi:uncharacterized protein (DUF305 family)